MIKTAITDMLGIDYPLIAGTMMNVSKPGFVAACSNAGGLGILASAIYREKEELREAIQEIRRLTDKPFAVNVNLFPMLQPVDLKGHVEVMIEEGTPVLETSGHKAPEDLVPVFKEAGVTWMHKCAGVKYARKGESLGADIVEVVSWENGGATGPLDIGAMVLIPSTVDALSVPVIAGGGITDGRGVAAALALGASGAIIGTRIMATKECPIHDSLKEAFVNAEHTDTVIVMESLHATHRVWDNAAARKVLELEATEGKPEEIFDIAAGRRVRAMYENGDLDAGVTSLGQGVGLIHDIPTMAELFDRIMKEAEGVLEKTSGLKV